MREAWLWAFTCMRIDERLLRSYVLARLGVIKQFFKNFEKCLTVKIEKPSHEFLIRAEPDNVVYVVAPLIC